MLLEEYSFKRHQSHHWKLNQSEVAISVRITNQKPGKKYKKKKYGKKKYGGKKVGKKIYGKKNEKSTKKKVRGE